MERKYGTNGEHFDCDDAAEAIQQLEDEGMLEVGAVYYSIAFEDVDLADLLVQRAPVLLEQAEDDLWELIGEASEDVFAVGEEASKALDEALRVWAGKHLTSTICWRAVGKREEHAVTAEDIAQHQGAEQS